MDSMRILTPPPPLADLRKRGPVAVFLDFDGTLVEIAGAPDAIDVPRDLSTRLWDLAERLDGRFALVSGRSIENLSEHLGHIAFACAGSHGLECHAAGGEMIGAPPAELRDDAREEIRSFAAANGLHYEEKAHGAALHYRREPSRGEDAERFAQEMARRFGLVIKRGKCVVELVVPGADKGAAVAALMRHPAFAGATPVFIGDDITDEDGFRVAEEMGGLGIIVGPRRETAARHRIDNVDEVYQWLDL